MVDQADCRRSMAIDRLALSRAQHFQSRDQRARSISDNDEEIDALSDWSESDRECCPLSDLEWTSNVDGTNHQYNVSFDEDQDLPENLPRTNTFLEQILNIQETPPVTINDSITSTHLSFASDTEKTPKIFPTTTMKTPVEQPTRKRSSQPPPLLPARRSQTKSVVNHRPIVNAPVLSSSRHRKTLPPPTGSPARFSLRREPTSNNSSLPLPSRKDSSVSMQSSSPSHDDIHLHQSLNNSGLPPPTASPILSHTSTNGSLVPRVYELKKIFIDDADYGRLSDVSTMKSVPPRNRQKWGTIVHPPFPLGYQHIPPEQVTHVVERLTSPSRSRDRRTPVQTPSKRYLSVEETDALVSRLSKVKSIRSPDPYFPIQRTSKTGKSFNQSLKSNQHWKSVGISA